MRTAGLERDGQEELTGRGEENPFLDLLGQIPMDGLEDVLRAFQGAQEEYASHGITTAQEGLLQPVMAPVYQEILRRGLLYLDVNAYVPPADYDRLRGQFAQGVSASPGTFQVAGMKIFLDGSPQGGTAWVREPYAGGGRGTSTMTDGQVLSAFRQALDRDAQLLAHCNGDRAAEQYLTLLAQAEREAGKKLCRPVMIHAQLLGLDQLERVKALGVIPSFFVAHVYHWGEIHVKNFGLDRAGRISPAGSALSWGIPFTFHQDSPVIPPDMLETIWCACVRRTKAGRVLGAEERIPVEAALRAVTQKAAHQYGLERELGTLRPGKRADFVLLSGDPLRTPPEELKKTPGGADRSAGPHHLEPIEKERQLWAIFFGNSGAAASSWRCSPPAGAAAGTGPQPVHPAAVHRFGSGHASGGAHLSVYLAGQAAGGLSRLVPDPGADSGGPGAVAAHQPRVGDRPHPVQRGGGAHLPRGH